MTSSDPDPDAVRYQEHWQPVLDAAALRLLERVAEAAALMLEPIGTSGPEVARPQLLDVGAGTGALTLAAAQRWPRARTIGLDASAGMLSVARRRGMALGWGSGEAGVLDWIVADAAAMPIADGSTEAAFSSFVLQLVEDRTAVLRDVHRVLRPGGVFGFVTWIAEELQMPADVAFDEAVYELELEEPDAAAEEPKPGDYGSLDEARDELVAAGFTDVDVRADRLSFSWSREGYLDFKRRYDERELFESLSDRDRERLAEAVGRRWQELPMDAFTLEAPLVSALARRP